jgi:uncharacterized protein YecE (DUF72 family)
MRPRPGTAGWTVLRAVADQFSPEDSSLERYAARLCGAEINSPFYRSHRPQTYARWVDATRPGFRFALKRSKAITRDARLTRRGALLAAFMVETGLLGGKAGGGQNRHIRANRLDWGTEGWRNLAVFGRRSAFLL